MYRGTTSIYRLFTQIQLDLMLRVIGRTRDDLLRRFDPFGIRLREVFRRRPLIPSHPPGTL